MTMGERIKKRMQALGLTQQRLGDKIDLSQRRVGHYANDKRRPPPEILIKLCDALEVTPGWLLGVADEEANPTSNSMIAGNNENDDQKAANTLQAIRAVGIDISALPADDAGRVYAWFYSMVEQAFPAEKLDNLLVPERLKALLRAIDAKKM